MDSLWPPSVAMLLAIAVFVLGATSVVLLEIRSRLDARESKNRHQQLEASHQERMQSQEGLVDRLGESVGEVVNRIGAVMVQPEPERRSQFKVINELIARNLLGVLATRHVSGRVVLYRLDSTLALEAVVSSGRLDQPRRFEPDTPRWFAVKEFLLSGQPLICNDVNNPSERPEHWNGTASGYEAFVACPVVIDDEAFGMLTFDVPQTGSLDRNDANALVIFAGLAACAANLVQDS